MTDSSQDAPTQSTAEEPVDLSDLHPSDSIVFVVFWALAVVVFLQFFTRYVLNASLGWTEEIARYLLIAVCFVGSVMALRKQNHIAVEILYRWMPMGVRRVLSTTVDLIGAVFFCMLAWVAAKLALRTRQWMVSIDLPKSIVYWLVSAACVAMAVLAVRIAWRHWRRGRSRLSHPEPTYGSRPSLE